MINIVVAEKGWVFVGRTERTGDRITISDCYNVRRWSLETKDGLGGLAERGPGKESNDILDKWRTTNIPVIAVICDQECNQTNWERWYKNQLKK